MAIVWLIVAAIMFIGELVCPIFFMFWFAIGALVALLCSLITANITIQIIVFFVVSLILLAFMKPLINKFFKSKTKDELNMNSIIGKHAIVTETVDDLNGTGKVKINGELWKAISENETNIIPQNAQVTVLKVDGVKLIVSPISDNVN